jgi:hypothetical protein
MQAFALLRKVHEKLSIMSDDEIRRHYGVFSNLMLLAVFSEECATIINSAAKNGFPCVSAIDKIILHGGLWKLIDEGLIEERQVRHTISLYGPIFPALEYYIPRSSLAPWITLGAQEHLLDMDLGQFVAIEYGSGMSTFFLNSRCNQVYSFEDDQDPAALDTWIQRMSDATVTTGVRLNVRKPIEGQDDIPELLLRNMHINTQHKLLVFIDGCDRVQLFKAWSSFMIHNPSLKIVLLVDNSEIPDFTDGFNRFYDNGFSIVHHYGQVYGQLTTKQCTSLVSSKPELLMSRSKSAPSSHDRIWGKLSFQDV